MCLDQIVQTWAESNWVGCHSPLASSEKYIVHLKKRAIIHSESSTSMCWIRKRRSLITSLKKKKLSSLIAQMVKKSPAMQETWVWSLGWEDPLEKEMATHYTILAWIIPWTEEPGRLKSRGSQRIRHDWVTFTLKKKNRVRKCQKSKIKLPFFYFSRNQAFFFKNHYS